MKRVVRTLACVTVVVAAGASATPTPVPTIAREQAVRIALAAVPGGRVKSAELESENGKLVWSFDITRRGTRGATEVQVDAVTGAIVSRKHESPADEAREAQSEKREGR
jgi:hypothetical protein